MTVEVCVCFAKAYLSVLCSRGGERTCGELCIFRVYALTAKCCCLQVTVRGGNSSLFLKIGGQKQPEQTCCRAQGVFVCLCLDSYIRRKKI